MVEGEGEILICYIYGGGGRRNIDVIYLVEGDRRKIAAVLPETKQSPSNFKYSLIYTFFADCDLSN